MFIGKNLVFVYVHLCLFFPILLVGRSNGYDEYLFDIFIVPWVHVLGDEKGRNVSALGDNDVTTCLLHDAKNTLVLKSAFNKFSSLTVTDVSNKGYVDPRRICVKSPGQPWLLLTHAASSLHGSTCDIFCGPLMPCVYVGVVYGRDTLFWHQMQCSCGTDGCNELMLHMLPDDQATILICDLMFA